MWIIIKKNWQRELYIIIIKRCPYGFEPIDLWQNGLGHSLLEMYTGVSVISSSKGTQACTKICQNYIYFEDYFWFYLSSFLTSYFSAISVFFQHEDHWLWSDCSSMQIVRQVPWLTKALTPYKIMHRQTLTVISKKQGRSHGIYTDARYKPNKSFSFCITARPNKSLPHGISAILHGVKTTGTKGSGCHMIQRFYPKSQIGKGILWMVGRCFQSP